jgi:hypothetical protein
VAAVGWGVWFGAAYLNRNFLCEFSIPQWLLEALPRILAHQVSSLARPAAAARAGQERLEQHPLLFCG